MVDNFEDYIKEAKFLDAASSDTFIPEYSYFKRVLELSNRKVNTIRPFIFNMEMTSIAVATASTNGYYNCNLKDDTANKLIFTTGTGTSDRTVAYFGHLNFYFSPPLTATTTGTWSVNLNLRTPRNNDNSGGAISDSIIPLVGFSSANNPYASATFTFPAAPSFNNWTAVDKFNTGDLDKIIFHSININVVTQALSSYDGFFHMIFKGYQADLT